MKEIKDGNTISLATYNALRSSILLAEIAPGTRITTADLCERFGASLGAVREALSHLRAEGLVTAEARRGYRISPVSVTDLQDLTQLRIDIETLCLTHSIEHGGVDWEADLVAVLYRLSKHYRENAPDGSPNPTFEAAHDAFHLALVSACGNARLLRLRAQLFQESERYRRLNASISRGRRTADEHRLIAEAALARDIGRATQLLAEHIGRTAKDIINAMSQDESGCRTKSGSTTRKRP